MFRKVVILSLMSFILLGCVKENLDDCIYGVYLRYSYTITPDGVNPFEGEMEKMSIFVFDDNKLFHEKFDILDPQKLLHEKVHLPLPAGKWHILSWGVGSQDMFDSESSYRVITMRDPVNSIFDEGLVKRQTTLDDFRLMIQYREGSNPGEFDIVERPEPLFYGQHKNIESRPGEVSEVAVGFTKNTNVIRVKVGGISNLPMRSAVTSSRELSSYDMNVYCKMRNGRYKYNNEIDDYARTIRYLQPLTQPHPDTLTVDFTVLRLMEQDNTSKLVLESPSLPQGKIEIDIVQAIIAYYDHINSQEDLDRNDNFDFTFNLKVDLGVTIMVNGFEVEYITGGFDKSK